MSLPEPLATVGAVAIDTEARTVTVIPAEADHAAYLWRQGYERLARAERSERGGRWGAEPTVWPDGPGGRHIARGEPEGGAMRFTFRKGDPAWAELVGTPGLSALITVDRRTSRILGVRFRGRKAV